MCRRPIGVIDAGLGGLTVLRELIRRLPAESYIYCGDSANTPYSGKPPGEVRRHIDSMLSVLEERQVKLAVIACNFISSVLQEELDAYPMPLLDIISPAARAAAADGFPDVLVFCPPGTERAGVHRRMIARLAPQIRVHTQSTAVLAKLIDDGMEDMPAIRREVSLQARRMDRQLGGRTAEIILGCTHFPFIRDLLARELPGRKILDPGEVLGRETVEYLTKRRLLCPGEGHGTLEILSSGGLEVCERMAALCGIHGAEIRYHEF